MNVIRELIEELRGVLAGRAAVVDILLPPAAFLLLNALLGFEPAMAGALAVAILLGALRLRRGQSALRAVGGLLSVGIAILAVRLSGREEGFFLPGIVSGVATVLLCLASLLVRRPLVAWTSYLARRWPLEWYWHPRVRPAYSEVTAAWGLFFGLRLALQLAVFTQGNADVLAIVQAVTGWPATIALLAVSYLYGLWRLRRLGGPSVEELRSGAPPPWQGQRKGF